jgi:hypothetical protein
LTAAQGYYGDSNIHIFEDEDGNRYMWKTAARKLEVGEIYRLKGTIKEHTKIEGIKEEGNCKILYIFKNIPILYVHQLQHALKLCGIDKEIVV